MPRVHGNPGLRTVWHVRDDPGSSGEKDRELGNWVLNILPALYLVYTYSSNPSGERPFIALATMEC